MLGVKKKGDGEYTPAEILADIEADIRLLSEAGSLSEIVEAGSCLWKIQHLANKALDQIKAKLRAEGMERYKRDGKAEQVIRSGDGSAWATVKIPNPSIIVRKDAKMDDARSQIACFSECFDRTVSYKATADFEEKVAALDDAKVRDALLGLIDRQENTPRISFRRKDSSG